jgi:hypothetical protein
MRIDYTEKKNHTHYIGVSIIDDQRRHIMNYSYRYESVIDYLTRAHPRKLTQKLDIMYLVKDSGDVYHVVLKTFWLRIMQRKWKKTIRERKEHRMRRCNPNVQYAYMISRHRK